MWCSSIKSTIILNTNDIQCSNVNVLLITEVPTPVHMGITLPVSISCLFPKEEKNVLSNHVQFVSENLRATGKFVSIHSG